MCIFEDRSQMPRYIYIYIYIYREREREREREKERESKFYYPVIPRKILRCAYLKIDHQIDYIFI